MPFHTVPDTKKPLRVFIDDLAKVEPQALDQLKNVASLPWVEGIAAMPDVHFGIGATVGSVIMAREALSPAAVGVDIGCGMCAVKTPYSANDIKSLDKTLATLRHSIERSVPVGFNMNGEVSDRSAAAFTGLGAPSSRATQGLLKKATHQLGSLGGGNHFIEICLDELDDVWVMLHSGSRNIGKELAQLHINKAKGLLGDLFKKYEISDIPDKDLAALVVGTPEYDDYLYDLMWCQRFAKANRDEMMTRVLKDLSYHFNGEDIGPGAMTKTRVDCHHNYVEETMLDGRPALVTRKGAVSAKAGELGIIPGSMGTRSYIVRGKGNPDSYCSCSHGAGRRMSRGAAKRTFTVEDFASQTAGVECRKDSGVLDEIPGAYKDIDEVMRNQSDLVDIEHTLKQIICVKG